MPLIYALFFLVAILYSSVGFGGGSLYIALLTFSSLPYQFIPVIALACNIAVVFGNCIQHIRHRTFSLRLVLPFVVLSMPAAYLGGSLPIEKVLLFRILGGALLLAGVILLLPSIKSSKVISATKHPLFTLVTSLALGGVIGFVSGMVGIGGGIFLAPILLLVNYTSSRNIASIASFYILVNSIFGLMGQFSKMGAMVVSDGVLGQLFLFILIVVVGGIIGNNVSFKWLDNRRIKQVTAVIILVAAFRILIFN